MFHYIIDIFHIIRSVFTTKIIQYTKYALYEFLLLLSIHISVWWYTPTFVTLVSDILELLSFDRFLSMKHNLARDRSMKWGDACNVSLECPVSPFGCSISLNWPRGYKTFLMLNSTEHEINPAH